MATPTSSEDRVERELNEIKRLLVLQLRRDGASQAEIAGALGVAQSSVSKMFSGGSPSPKTRKKSSKR